MAEIIRASEGWGASEDTVRLEAALRAALAARGVPKAVYVDNGSAAALKLKAPGLPKGRVPPGESAGVAARGGIAATGAVVVPLVGRPITITTGLRRLPVA